MRTFSLSRVTNRLAACLAGTVPIGCRSGKTLRLLLGCILLCTHIGVCHAAEQEDDLPSLQEIGELHKTTKQLIRSVSLVLEYEWSVLTSMERKRIDRWRRVPGKERITWNVETLDNPKRFFLRDVVIDHTKNEVSMLSYVGLAREIPPLTIRNQRDVQGLISPYVQKYWYNPAPVRLGLVIQDLTTNPYYELDALCRRKSGVTVKGWSMIEGKRCARIHIVLPSDEDASLENDATVDVYVDPTAGWLARKVVYESAPPGKPELRYRRELVVQEFHSAGSGVFFPLRVRRKQIGGSRLTEDCVIFVKDLKLNQPIPERELQLVFPKNLLVSRFDQAWGSFNSLRADTLLIGEGGKVVRTFSKDKPEEFRAFLEEHGVVPPKSADVFGFPAGSQPVVRDGSSSTAFGWYGVVIVSVILGTGGIALVAVRWRLSRATRQAATVPAASGAENGVAAEGRD